MNQIDNQLVNIDAEIARFTKAVEDLKKEQEKLLILKQAKWIENGGPGKATINPINPPESFYFLELDEVTGRFDEAPKFAKATIQNPDCFVFQNRAYASEMAMALNTLMKLQMAPDQAHITKPADFKQQVTQIVANLTANRLDIVLVNLRSAPTTIATLVPYFKNQEAARNAIALAGGISAVQLMFRVLSGVQPA